MLIPIWRDFFKAFTPLLLSLVFFVGSGFLVFNDLEKAQKQNTKFNEELGNLYKGISSLNEPYERWYSFEDYGFRAHMLNRVREKVELIQRESMTINRAFEEINLLSSVAEDVVFDFMKIIEKKLELEQLILTINQVENQIERIETEFARSVVTSPEIPSTVRSSFLAAHLINAKQAEFIRKQPYVIKRKIVREFINFLDFFSNVYGKYQRPNGFQGIFFFHDVDLRTYNSFIDRINGFILEERSFLAKSQQNM
ncbi:MAG: hypothetical protein HKM07_05425 [Chlamydiae bacterium]|nr:hypothetical protein [Chlamydiota bacterium]